MGHDGETGVRGRPAPPPAPNVHIEPQRGKVVVDCVIHPNKNRRRIMCSPSTSFFDIAADLEAALAVPATVCSLSDLDGSVRHSGPLPFAQQLSAFGLKPDDHVTIEVHLLRKPTCILKESPTIEGGSTGHMKETDNQITSECHDERTHRSAESSNTNQKKVAESKDDSGETGQRLAAGERDMANKASDRRAEQMTFMKSGQESCTESMYKEDVERPSSTRFFEAVTRWQAFSADSLDPILPELVECKQATRSTQTREETTSQRKTKFHTETQTYVWGNSGVQLKREAAVQMQKRGLYISDAEDKLLEPSGAYLDADTLQKKKSEKSVIIQASVRRFLAQKKARALRKIKEEQEGLTAACAVQGRRERDLFERREETRCLRPETYDDFRTLYAGLELWRRQEAKRIKQVLTKEEHQRAFIELLQKETEVLQHIEELKMKAKRENKQEKIRHILDLLAQPFEWLSASTGEITTVYTPETMRAGELRDLYIELSKIDLPPKKRLAVLLHIRERVADAAFNRGVPALIGEFNELIEREIDWLRRGRANNERLGGLRQRLIHAFWYLIQTPQFNPQAARFLKFPHRNLLAC